MAKKSVWGPVEIVLGPVEQVASGLSRSPKQYCCFATSGNFYGGSWENFFFKYYQFSFDQKLLGTFLIVQLVAASSPSLLCFLSDKTSADHANVVSVFLFSQVVWDFFCVTGRSRSHRSYLLTY